MTGISIFTLQLIVETYLSLNEFHDVSGGKCHYRAE